MLEVEVEVEVDERWLVEVEVEVEGGRSYIARRKVLFAACERKSEMEGEVNETGDEEGALMKANNVPEVTVIEISGGQR